MASGKIWREYNGAEMAHFDHLGWICVSICTIFGHMYMKEMKGPVKNFN